jgi:single-stranded DNA-binding protein
VTYSGRLGTDPRTKVTPKGKLVMEFPVAVAVEGQEKPNWHNTVVFDEKARKLDGVLAKGITVDCIAYEHRKVRRDEKTGKRRETVEYYATAVTPKLRKTSSEKGATGNDLERQTADAVFEGAERPNQQERSARPGQSD